MSEAEKWAGSQERAAKYCDCVIEKVKAKYPNEDDAMKYIDSLVNDKDLRACKDSLTTQ